MSSPKSKLEIKPSFKLWFEARGKYIFGEGAFGLLEKIQEEGSLNAATKSLGMSYRYAWGLIRDIEKHLGKPVIKTQRGGRQGGKTELTETGFFLTMNYRRLKKALMDVCKLE
ncbi:MAG: LysR family transcriptional regulator [Candidatus Bathyarchaeota archaeon]|nr:MAG: LysR family transcriptional regulator [Candidatus Bathyarchaeota archaeon]